MKAKSFLCTGYMLNILLTITFNNFLLAQPTSSNYTTIKYTGSIPYFLYYTDKYLEQKEFFFVKNIKTGHYNDLKIIIREPTLVRFSGNNDQIAVQLYPTDTILIDPEHFNIVGKRKEELNYYLLLDKKGVSMSIPDFWTLDWTSKMNFQAVISEFQFLRKKRLDVLDSLVKTNKVSNKFYLSAFNEVNSAYTYALLLPFIKTHKNNFTLTMLPKFYMDSVYKQKDFFNNHNLIKNNSFYYRPSLLGYVQYLCFSAGEKYNINGFYKIARDSLKVPNRDYALFSIVKSELQNNEINENFLLRDFSNDIHNSEYLLNIDSTIKSKQSMKHNAVFNQDFLGTNLETLDGHKISWKQILLNNKKAVVYADFWASWCIPCRKEMPSSKNIFRIIDSKRIKFIYISIDKDRVSWFKAINSLGINSKNLQNYRLDPNSALCKFLTKNSIPKYMIIDTKGAINSMDAPRPSDNNIINVLNHLAIQ